MRSRRVAEYVPYATHLLQFFQNNQHFPNPGDRLDTLSDVIEGLNSIEGQIKGLYDQIRELSNLRKNLRKDLEHAESGLVNYVNEVAKGNADLVNISPFEAQKEKGSTAGGSTLVTGLKVKDLLTSRVVRLKWKHVKAASAYIVEYRVNGMGEQNDVWRLVPSATIRNTLQFRIRIDGDGVDRSEVAPLVHFRVAATIDGTESAWSNEVKAFVS